MKKNNSILKLCNNTALSILGLLGLALIAALPMAGCGGGGGGSSSSTPAAGTTVSGASAGQIEGFGSVIVNGIEFETPASTELDIEGIDSPVMTDLSLGMTIVVTGSFNDDGLTGTATGLTVRDNLEGPITAIVETTAGVVKELTVLGQSIIVEVGVTNFDDGATFATLAIDQVIEVSGLPGATMGTVIASRVEKKADTTAEFLSNGGIFELKGTVANLAATTFTIGTLTIDFTGITPTDGTLADGIMVEVKGTDIADSTLTADSIEIYPNGLGLTASDKVEIEGYISDLTGTTFMLNGQLVNFSVATFSGGIQADLANGLKVEAEGPIVNSILQATEIILEESVRIEDNAAGPIVGNELLLDGLNLTIMIDSMVTEVIAPVGFIAGDGVKLHGRLTPSGAILATRIENVSPRERVELQGPVTTIAAPNLTILGISVDTSTISDVGSSSGSEFEVEDFDVSSAEFFAAVTAAGNPIVKVEADLPTPLVWNHIELEIEDN